MHDIGKLYVTDSLNVIMKRYKFKDNLFNFLRPNINQNITSVKISFEAFGFNFHILIIDKYK